MNANYIPVVVERAFEHGFPSMLLFKLRAPGTITMLQFLDKIRARLKLPPIQAVHFVLEEGLPVGMSQTLKTVYKNNRSKAGLLHVTCVSENTFGCIPPYKKPIRSKFPGTEALPFGAPEPVLNPGFEYIYEALFLPEQEPVWQQGQGPLTQVQATLNNWIQSMVNPQLQDQYNEPWPEPASWPEPDIFNNLPVPVQLQSSTSLGELMEGVSETSSDEDSNAPVDVAQIMTGQFIYHHVYVSESDLTSGSEEET